MNDFESDFEFLVLGQSFPETRLLFLLLVLLMNLRSPFLFMFLVQLLRLSFFLFWFLVCLLFCRSQNCELCLTQAYKTALSGDDCLYFINSYTVHVTSDVRLLNTLFHVRHYWAWYVDINGGWPDSRWINESLRGSDIILELNIGVISAMIQGICELLVAEKHLERFEHKE